MRSFTIAVLAMICTSPLTAQGARTPRFHTVPRTAEEVVNRYKLASGDKDPDQFKFHHIITETSVLGGVGAMTTEIFRTPTKMLMRLTMPQMGTSEMGFNGSVGWTYSAVTGPMLIDSSAAEEMRLSTRDNGAFFSNAKSLTLVGTRDIEGRKSVHLRVHVRDTTHVSFYFDVESGLMTALGSPGMHAPGGGGDTTALMLFSDYRRFDGVLVPTLMTIRSLGYSMTARTTHLDHKAIDSTVFVPPAPVRELLAKRAH